MFSFRYHYILIFVITLWPATSFAAPPSPVIKITLNDWTSQRVLSKVVAQIYQQHGLSVEFIEIPVELQWSAMRTGRTHLQIEVWQDSMAKDYSEYLAEGHIANYGSHSATTREEWWYPNYVESLCPGLPDWRALRNCAAIFADKQSNGLGVYYKGHWNFDDALLIRGLNLPFEIRTLPTDSQLWQKLKTALAQQKPILLLNWTPNWLDDNIQGKFVEFPAYTQECEIDPKWGINPHLTHDCGNPKGGWLKKAGWPGLKQYSPCAADILKKVTFDKEMIEDAASYVVRDGFTEQQAVMHWLKKYDNIVKTWTSSSCSKVVNRE